MIKLSELRIGNIVLYKQDNDELPVLKIDGDKCTICLDLLLGLNMELNEQDIDPIPLTLEWLERCGFRKDMGGGGGLLEFDNGFICFYDLHNPLIGYSGISDELINGGPISNLKYVHQLQNLYFALTGEELIIKP